VFHPRCEALLRGEKRGSESSVPLDWTGEMVEADAIKRAPTRSETSEELSACGASLPPQQVFTRSYAARRGLPTLSHSGWHINADIYAFKNPLSAAVGRFVVEFQAPNV
jgi:hypothetical protein